ncbi:MAG: class I SAM-dependent methyltransferase [Deltaproteobacteria bacterium]|nr:class I SAM-dependent methyltransferase [Deltaproteobacteria bacterium]MBW2388194.1 class I SAM-dependent methyltransferase [Deltaproteobacteria bacterium]MBW2724678.1 class I SAM-dependent methyltransferase [Deltaproteobacteria bacterium]
MNDEEFRLLDRIEEDHWWFVGKRLILRAVLGANVRGDRLLDLGCGTGGVLRHWMDENHSYGIDRNQLALEICARNGFDRLVRGDLTALPFRPESFQTVLLLDVIEHIDDDVAFLRAVSELCAVGGRVVVAVPAFQLLWSQHDETFEHRRRYSARQLEAVLRRSGLEPERLTFTNTLLFPVAAIWRLASYRLGLGRFAPKHDFWPIPRWLNRMLTGLYILEARLLERFDLPFGVSLLCVARRPPRGRT